MHFLQCLSDIFIDNSQNYWVIKCGALLIRCQRSQVRVQVIFTPRLQAALTISQHDVQVGGQGVHNMCILQLADILILMITGLPCQQM